MEAPFEDADAEMGAELDDLLADSEEDDDGDASQQPPAVGEDGLDEEIDDALDEDDDDLRLATEQSEGQLAGAPPVEEGYPAEGYAVEEGYLPDGAEGYRDVYTRHGVPGAMHAGPSEDNFNYSRYDDEGPSNYHHDGHQGEYHHYHDDGEQYNNGGFLPQQEALPSSSRQERSAADEQMQQRNMQIFKAMTPEQLSRYEAYRRSLCPAPKVKKLMQHVMGASVQIQPQLVLAMRGVAKMYVGEIIECARQVASEMGHKGPLLPCHVQRAYGILEGTNRVPRRDGPRSRLRL